MLSLKRAAAPLLVALLSVPLDPAAADVTFYTDEAAWTAAIGGAGLVASFDTTATNLAAADELAGPPVQDQSLGSQLTLRASNTGLCGSVVLQAREPGADLVFDDGLPSPPSFPPNTVSIGSLLAFDDDDFRLVFPTDAFYAVGLFLVDNTQEASERFSAYGATGLLGSLPGASIPDSSGNGSTFVGVVATVPLHSVRFDEGSLPGDDIAVRDLRLGCSAGDPDADGLGNAAEIAAGTDPANADSDADGLPDGDEIGTGVFATENIDFVGQGGLSSTFAADVDGDGDRDALATSFGGDLVLWYENTDGSGSFGARQIVTDLAFGAQCAKAADVDGDGDVDVMVSSALADNVSWFENTDGLGTFGPARAVTVSADLVREIAVADLDGDGDVDVLYAAQNDDEIAWHENTDGAGSFGPKQAIATIPGAFRVFAADLDGDGDLDALWGGQDTDTIAWQENVDGSGAFGPPQVISTTALKSNSVFAADLDGDGDNDLLTGEGTIGWYENTDGLGSFGMRQEIPAPLQAGYIPRAVDIEGDGDRDVLSAGLSLPFYPSARLSWFENADGSGTFGGEQLIDTHPAGYSASVGDLDGDGDVDVLTGSSQSLDWHRQTNASDPTDPDTDDDGLLDGVETNTGVFVSPGDTGTDPLLADTDGDGFDDGVEVARGSDPNDPEDVPQPQLAPALSGLGRLLVAALLVAGARSLRRRR